MSSMEHSTICLFCRALSFRSMSMTIEEFRPGSAAPRVPSSFDLPRSTLSLLQGVRSGTTVALKTGWVPDEFLREQIEWSLMDLCGRG